jgi:hypothetical protein
MKTNSTFLIIGTRKFLIEDISISDSGEVSYQIYSLSDVSEEDKKHIDDAIHKLLGL